MSSGNWRPFCLGLDELNPIIESIGLAVPPQKFTNFYFRQRTDNHWKNDLLCNREHQRATCDVASQVLDNLYKRGRNELIKYLVYRRLYWAMCGATHFYKMKWEVLSVIATLYRICHSSQNVTLGGVACVYDAANTRYTSYQSFLHLMQIWFLWASMHLFRLE